MSEMFSIFVCVGQPALHIDESVFTVLLRKCGSFKEERTMDSTHSCLDYVGRGYNILSFLISVQVWGIGCHLSSSGFYHNLLRDNEISSTLSVFMNTGAGVGPDIIISCYEKVHYYHDIHDDSVSAVIFPKHD